MYVQLMGMSIKFHSISVELKLASANAMNLARTLVVKSRIDNIKLQSMCIL